MEAALCVNVSVIDSELTEPHAWRFVSALSLLSGISICRCQLRLKCASRYACVRNAADFLSQQLIEQIDLEINREELASVRMLIRVICDPT